jgi:hypothetical protein
MQNIEKIVTFEFRSDAYYSSSDAEFSQHQEYAGHVICPSFLIE